MPLSIIHRWAVRLIYKRAFISFVHRHRHSRCQSATYLLPAHRRKTENIEMKVLHNFIRQVTDWAGVVRRQFFASSHRIASIVVCVKNSLSFATSVSVLRAIVGSNSRQWCAPQVRMYLFERTVRALDGVCAVLNAMLKTVRAKLYNFRFYLRTFTRRSSKAERLAQEWWVGRRDSAINLEKLGDSGSCFTTRSAADCDQVNWRIQDVQCNLKWARCNRQISSDSHEMGSIADWVFCC